MIVFSEHARVQTRRRKIQRSVVIKTIRDPEETEPGFRDRIIRRKKFGTKTLEVVTITEGVKITVVTAYFTKG